MIERHMQYGARAIRIVIGTASVVLLFAASSVSAARLTSPNYELDTNLGGSFSGSTSSTSYKMESVGGEAVVGNGAGGSYTLSQQPPSNDTALLEISTPATPIVIGQISSGQSKAIDFDIGVQSTAAEYSLSIQQDHNLQTADASASIPAAPGSTGLPLPWEEGGTIGLGYSVVSAPQLDGKWGAGANFAAFPGVATTFYNGTSGTHTIGMRVRIDVTLQQAIGEYSNQVTVSGVTVP